MTNLSLAVEQLQNAELELALELGEVADRHAVEREVFEVCAAFAHECQEHVKRLRPLAGRFRSRRPAVEPDGETWESPLRESPRPSTWAADRWQLDSGLRLLHDLRRLYHRAQEVSLFWSLMGQVGRVLRDRDLLDAAAEMHRQNLAQLVWIDAKLKEIAPRVLLAR